MVCPRGSVVLDPPVLKATWDVLAFCPTLCCEGCAVWLLPVEMCPYPSYIELTRVWLALQPSSGTRRVSDVGSSRSARSTYHRVARSSEVDEVCSSELLAKEQNVLLRGREQVLVATDANSVVAYVDFVRFSCHQAKNDGFDEAEQSGRAT